MCNVLSRISLVARIWLAFSMRNRFGNRNQESEKAGLTIVNRKRSLAAQPLAKNGGSGNTAILKLFCRNAINKLRGWWETLLNVN